MNKFDAITRSLFSQELVNKSVDRSILESGQMYAANSQTSAPAEYEYQTFIRSAFGKQGLNSAGTGSHPDFSYLSTCESTELHYIATLFVDIKRSTRQIGRASCRERV